MGSAWVLVSGAAAAQALSKITKTDNKIKLFFIVLFSLNQPILGIGYLSKVKDLFRDYEDFV